MQLKTGISGTQKPGLPSSMEKKSTTTARDRQCYNQIMPPSWCMPHNLQNTSREGLVLLINFLNKNIEAWSKKVCIKQYYLKTSAENSEWTIVPPSGDECSEEPRQWRATVRCSKRWDSQLGRECSTERPGWSVWCLKIGRGNTKCSFVCQCEWFELNTAATGSQLSVFKSAVACVNLGGSKTRWAGELWTNSSGLRW